MSEEKPTTDLVREWQRAEQFLRSSTASMNTNSSGESDPLLEDCAKCGRSPQFLTQGVRFSVKCRHCGNTCSRVGWTKREASLDWNLEQLHQSST